MSRTAQSIRRLGILVGVAASIFLGLPASSLADTFTATASLSGTTASVGSPVLASVDFGSPFVSIDGVCFQFTFQNDLLDVGDFLRVTPLNLLPSLTGPGFSNPGPGSQATRTLCLFTAFGYKAITSLFLDGSENRIEIGMESGSVTIGTTCPAGFKSMVLAFIVAGILVVVFTKR